MTTSRLRVWACLAIPVVVGAVIMLAGGAPAGRWAVQLVSLALGPLVWLAFRAVRRRLDDGRATIGLLVAIGLVALTLFGMGIARVQRWHELGPLRLHASALLAPALVVFAAVRAGSRPGAAHAVLLVLQLIHLAQPDAGQATAVGAAGVILASVTAAAGMRSRSRAERAIGFGLIPAYLGTTVLAWLRPDPLLPVPFVEDILARAFRQSAALGVTGVLSFLPFVLAPLALGRGTPRSLGYATGQIALAVYFAGSLLATSFGAFPVPLLGFGASPVLGAFLGLAALERASAVRPAIP